MRRFSAWRERNVLVVDTMAALLFALLFAGTLSSTSNTPGLLFDYGVTGQMLWTFALLVPLAIRRWRPQTAALTYAALVVVHLVFGPSMLMPDFLSLVMVYSVIAYGDPRNTKPFIVLSCGVGLLATMIITWSVDVGPFFDGRARARQTGPYSDCATVYERGLSGRCAENLLIEGLVLGIIIALCLVSTIIIAYWQRARQATIRMMVERNEAIAARQDEERRIAALAERARIARDMHDVVAHTLSIIIVQSDGGRYAGADNPQVARETMETIRHESERALHDMKRLLGVFGGSPHAEYGDIDALVEQARAASPDCEIRRRVVGRADASRLSDEASMALYRVVQEALTNVRKYAGPKVVVHVVETWGDDGVRVEVTDNGRGAASGLDGHSAGYGLIGMRERIDAVGGTLEAGPRIGGGFEVRATLPYAATAPATSEAPATPAVPSPTQTPAEPAAPMALPPAHGVTAAAPATKATPTTSATSVISTASQPYAARRSATPADASPRPNLNDSPSDSQGNGPFDARRSDVPQSDTPPAGHDRSDPQAAGRSGRQADGGRRPSLGLPKFPLTQGITPPRLPSLSTIRDSLQSRTIDQAESAGGEFNWIERLSRWSERHYVLTDVFSTLALIAVMTSDLFRTAVILTGDGDFGGTASYTFVIVMVVAPLMFRRRFPEASALFIAVFCAFQLMFMPIIVFADVLVLYAVYSMAAYGRPRAWIRAGIACLIDSVMLGLKIFVRMLGYGTIYDAMVRLPVEAPAVKPQLRTAATAGVMYTVVVMLLCCGMIAFGRWTQARGSNALILQAREEALRAEQDKQKVLAANMERDRISANIQAEVTDTLNGVIDQAVAGLTMLDDCAGRGQTPSPESIGAAFASIGRQGRDALAHMRQLLGVLRETGFSDADRRERGRSMQLTPAKSLDEQLRDAGPR